MSSFNRRVVKYIFTLLIYFYGAWYGFVNNLSSFQVLGVIPGVIVYALVYTFKLPQPPNEQVRRILGTDPMESDDNNSDNIKTVAHRGAGLDAPENSLVAFRMCADKGCSILEFDVNLTSDAVPVIFHDSNLLRMTGVDMKIADCTYEEIQCYDISINHPFRERFSGTRIPTLDQAIKQCLLLKQHMFIDLKVLDTRVVKIILDLFEKYPILERKAVVTSFFPNLIYLIRRSNPTIVCSLAYRPYFFSNVSYSFVKGKGPRRAKTFIGHCLLTLVDTIHAWALPKFTYYILGISVILLQKDCISPCVVENWRQRGIRVFIWTVNHPIEKQYFYRTLKCTYLSDTLVGESLLNLNTLEKQPSQTLD